MNEREVPSFIREFSREKSQEERKKVADEIRKKRAEYPGSQTDDVESRVPGEKFDALLAELETFSNFDPDKNVKQNIESIKFTETRRLLYDFYKKERGKWEKSDFTEDDLSKYFSDEYLSNLSLEDYALLLKRFPNEMVTHVTRQGVRDHVGHFGHTVGFGKFHHGFENILESARVRSILGIYMNEEDKENTV